ncbi:MAG: MBL fold metallo-hydrolase, partial [Eggerthellaceae bacterium]|nr:MBL fold metallo-hydrolase [Eggerthellaceae bacterium]
MEIIWYGTASILMQDGDTSLMFDPFLKDDPSSEDSEIQRHLRRQAFKGQSNILITHGHFDHLSSVGKLYKDEECAVYVTRTPYDTLV